MKILNNKGQGVVEYALIVLAIVGIIVAVLFPGSPLRGAITGLFDNVVTAIKGANAGK